MDKAEFEAELKRDGYEMSTSTTPGAKVNPEHHHPFDIRAMVLKGAVTLTCDGKTETYKPGEIFTMERGRLHFESYGEGETVALVGRKR
jgi:quercetin dioxygenase-like cupin family protein